MEYIANIQITAWVSEHTCTWRVCMGNYNPLFIWKQIVPSCVIKLNPPNWYKKQTGHRSDSERDTKLQEWLKNNMPCLFLVIYIKNNNNCYNDLCWEFVFLCNFASTYIILQYFALLNMTISFWCFFFHTSYLFVVFCSHFFLFYTSFYCILLWSFFTSE